jgi:hypothetical protein
MLNAFVLPDEVALDRSERRGCVLKTLVSEFRTTFAGVKYELDLRIRTVNAQAFEQGGCRFVRLYCGFAFHPLISEDALVFALLHETGHHCARGRRLAGDPRFACDCLADKWAVGVGAQALRRCSGRILNVFNALNSLDALIASIEVRAGQSAPAWTGRARRPTCWGGFWPSRKSRLISHSIPAPTGPCYYSC